MKSSRVYLSIGSNIGDRESNIAQAISALEVSEKNYNLDSASFYLTEPLTTKIKSFLLTPLWGWIHT